jgi:ATP-dependent Clp protease protease subunit
MPRPPGPVQSTGEIETPGYAFERPGHGRRARGAQTRGMHRLERPPADDDDDKTREPSLLFQRELVKSRTVLIFGEVTTELAYATAAQLLALAARGDEPIRVVIHSPGGHVEAGDTIFDVIRFIRPEVVMIGSGWVASAGALIYAAAEKKNRLSLPNTRFLLHQPLGGFQGRADDIEIETAQILGIRDRLQRTFADATGQPIEKISRDMERNHWMNAEEARAYGLVDRIVTRATDV